MGADRYPRPFCARPSHCCENLGCSHVIRQEAHPSDAPQEHPLHTMTKASSLRQSMASLHTWTGLLPGWLLYVVFLFGTVAFFQQEISRWMRPELHDAPVTPRALDGAARYLATHAPHAASWTITLPDERGGSPLSLSWKAPGKGKAGKQALDPATGEPLNLRDTKGGFFLYRMHFDLHYIPVMTARLVVSVAALAMLVAILSGIVTHKKIFADFFMLRFGKGQRSWLDAHNVTAVLALPFYLMMTYTGLVTLLYTLMPWAVSAHFPDLQTFYKAAYPTGPVVEASARPAPVLPLSQLADKATQAWGDGTTPGYITINHPGDAVATIDLYPASTRLGATGPRLQLSAVDGRVLMQAPPDGPAVSTQRVMVQLHMANFSQITLRWLYFLSGLAGTVMVGSGLSLWVVKRRARLPDPARPHAGFRLVEKLNIAVIAGAPLGIAAYFLANRLLPPDMDHRTDAEINSLFIVWGAALVWGVARPTRRAWSELLSACAAAYALVPLVSAMTTGRGLLPSLIAQDWVFVGFDLAMLATAALFAFTARRVAGHRARPAPRRPSLRAAA